MADRSTLRVGDEVTVAELVNGRIIRRLGIVESVVRIQHDGVKVRFANGSAAWCVWGVVEIVTAARRAAIAQRKGLVE